MDSKIKSNISNFNHNVFLLSIHGTFMRKNFLKRNCTLQSLCFPKGARLIVLLLLLFFIFSAKYKGIVYSCNLGSEHWICVGGDIHNQGAYILESICIVIYAQSESCEFGSLVQLLLLMLVSYVDLIACMTYINHEIRGLKNIRSLEIQFNYIFLKFILEEKLNSIETLNYFTKKKSYGFFFLLKFEGLIFYF